MNIVYNCNDAFAVHTAVSIASLFDNNRGSDLINVYILANALSSESKERFAKLESEFDTKERPRHIETIDLKDYSKMLKLAFGGKVDTGSFDPTVLARLFAPAHLPDEVERYIYLDADTVVLGDISRLWETKLDGAVCGMAAEPTIYAKTKQILGMSEDDAYYNSGVILTDRLKWEEEGISSKCIDCYNEAGGKGLDFPDQDIINVVLKGRFRTLWQGWNFFSNYHYRDYKSLKLQAGWYAGLVTKEAYEAARLSPSIVHFAGGERPWLRANRNPYRESYAHYLEFTEWRGTPLQKGKEADMLLYHCVNLVTKACPRIRMLISALYLKIRTRK